MMSDFPQNCQDNCLAAQDHKPLRCKSLIQAKQGTSFHAEWIRHLSLHRPHRNKTLALPISPGQPGFSRRVAAVASMFLTVAKLTKQFCSYVGTREGWVQEP